MYWEDYLILKFIINFYSIIIFIFLLDLSNPVISLFEKKVALYWTAWQKNEHSTAFVRKEGFGDFKMFSYWYDI